MHFLKELVDQGYSQIYELAYEYEESEAGYGSHKATGSYVGKKGDQHFQIEVEERARYGFGAKRTFDIASERQISKDEYATLFKDKNLLDTPEHMAEIEAQNKRMKLRYEAHDKLNDIQHKCPACGTVMTWRSGKYGPFWGCNKYPVCMYTMNMSPEETLIYEQYAGEGKFALEEFSRKLG